MVAFRESISMRGMAYALKNGKEDERQLVELKAVDGLYPLYGKVGLSPNIKLADALKCIRDVCGAVAEQTLLDRLHISRGGLMRIGTQNFRLTAVLASEPDRISGGFSLGPHVMVSDEGAEAHRPRHARKPDRIYLSRGDALRVTSPEQFRAAAAARIPGRGMGNPRPHQRRARHQRFHLEQVTMFLTLVGLTALAVGGVGAGQAVSAFLDRKRSEIATLKSLGADGGLIFLTFFLQVMAIAALAVAIGLVGGRGPALPRSQQFLGNALPIPANFAIFPVPLALAAVFGLLSAAAFGIPPLARAREIQPASLFRDHRRAQQRARTLALSSCGGDCGRLHRGSCLRCLRPRRFSRWNFLAASRRP